VKSAGVQQASDTIHTGKNSEQTVNEKYKISELNYTFLPTAQLKYLLFDTWLCFVRLLTR
jgi:hypothetical protein